jgi:hypothetical protein
MAYQEWRTAAEIDRLDAPTQDLLEWAWPLAGDHVEVWRGSASLAYSDRNQDHEPNADDVWHLSLDGRFRSASAASQADRSACYGKGTACLDDGRGMTTCAEVDVAKRLTKHGWDGGGWWNPYREDAPARWAVHEAGQFALRSRVDGTPFEKLFQADRGYADVIAWKGSGADIRIVAIECKRIGKDSIKPYQRDWLTDFAAIGGLSSLAVAHWRLGQD